MWRTHFKLGEILFGVISSIFYFYVEMWNLYGIRIMLVYHLIALHFIASYLKVYGVLFAVVSKLAILLDVMRFLYNIYLNNLVV